MGAPAKKLPMHQDLTAVIERLPELEAHFGIRQDHLFAHVIGDENTSRLSAQMVLNGEIRPVEGAALPASLHLIASIHDDAGRVLAVMREFVEQDGFHGFQAFSIGDFQTLSGGGIARIKLYPQGFA